MTLKEFLKKFPTTFQTVYEKKNDQNFIKKLGIIVYPVIFLASFMIYFNTHNAINDKTYHDENNLENFFNSKK